MDVLRAFCDFQRYGPERGFLSPCREFVLITISHLVILFYSLITLTHFLIQSPQNVSVNRVPSLLFAIASACTVLVVACQMAIPFDPRHGMPAVLLMAYSLAVAVWLSCSVTHFLAFFRHRCANVPLNLEAPNRPLPLLPCIPSAIPALIFLLISTQRWISFGPLDPRSLLTFMLLIIQTISALLPVLSGKFLRRPSRDWSQLNGAIGEEDGTVHETNRLVYSERKEGNWIGYIFSETFFCWTNPLLQKGYKRQLRQVEDVFELPPSLDLHALEQVLLSPNTGAATATQPGFSFAPVLLRVYGRPFALLGVLRLVGDLFKFASPVLLHLLINSLQDSASFETGYICSALMFTAMFLSSICDFHFNYQISMLTIRAKTAMLLAVYEKLLHIPAFKLTDDFSSGKLINLMSTDVERIGGFIASFHAFWSMPMNFTIALYLLYREIGLAFLAGLAISLLLIPINKYIAFKIGSFSKKMMEAKDSRMKLVNELARSMRTVKLNNLEPFFESKINTFRQKELENLKGMKYLDAVCVYLWASAPLVITVLMIYTYSAILHEQLTAAKVFTMMALVQILITPLNAFPWVLSSIVNGLVSKRRFDSFFAIQCRANSAQPIYEPMEDCGDGILMQLQGNSFGWTEEGIPAVDNIRFSGKKGTLIGVVGPVGSGKSTLLMGLLGETTFRGQPIQVDSELLNAGFALVGQDIWLQAGTVRDNILCGRLFKEDTFQKAVEACALQLDIQSMPGHENYRISGEGITLSGGQKVRLALARALYADKPVYLLDDPFAALDRTVAHFVYDNCVQKALRKRGKLVILCTHHEEFLREADLVIRLSSSGEVESIGNPDEVLAEKQSQQFNLAMQSSTAEESPMEAAEFVGAEDEEEKEEGAVKIRVYQSYFAAIGIGMCVTIFFSLLAMRVSKNASDIWLSIWASNADSGQNHSIQDWNFPFSPRPVFAIPLEQQDNTNFYLLVYVAIAALNSIFTLARAFLFAFGCILAAQRLHERILARIMGASISWWDRTPCGRVTNRLSSDVAMVDDSLPFQLNIFLASLFALIATLLVTVVALPLLIPLIFILFVVYYFIQKYYRRTTVELKRITALSLSPLYSHLSETVSGLVSIRAFRITEQFSATMRHRLAQNLRAQFSSLACTQWLMVRIQMLGVAIVTVIALASVLDVALLGLAQPGLLGLAITYALSLTGVLNGILTSFIETEKELVSVERICDYVENVPVEGGEEEAAKEAIGQLMCRRINGQIRFTGVSLRYGPDLPLAIRDVSFCIEAGQRVAIVGRTGSGKSTILQALLRAHPIEAGKMFIDEVIDLESIGLKTARSLFGFVSQHPFLFSGTLRDNLCMASAQPLEDAQMEAIIAETGLAQWFRQIGGLEAEITEGGRNLSFGERQLISLLRLALTRPRIVLIDEATAHMDERTHTLMGRLIGGMGCTLVAIVHRLTGLDNFDWVIEMNQGQIARQGPPALFAVQ